MGLQLTRGGEYGLRAMMYLARVPRGALTAAPEYWTPDGWTGAAGAARPFLQRHWAEFPLQPRYVDGQWVGVAAVNG